MFDVARLGVKVRARRPRRRITRLTRLLTGLAAVLLAFTLAPTAAGAAPSPTPKPAASPTPAPNNRATFGIGPATNGTNDSRPFFAYTTGPGGVLRDDVAVDNYSAEALDLIVYATDLTNGADGSLGVAPEDRKVVDAGGWIHLPQAKQTVHVPPSSASGPGRVILPFTLQVSLGASPGDHSAGIVASLQTLGKNPKGQNVKLDQRVATRVYTRVKGDIVSTLSIENVKVSYTAASNPIGRGTAHVTYRLRNSGNVNVGAHQVVYVTGLFGTKATAKPIADLDILLPNARTQMSVDIPGVLPTIWENLHIEASPRVVTGQADNHGTGAKVTKSFHAIPWLLLAIVLGLIVLTILALLLLRRRRPPRDPKDKGNGGNGPKGGPDGGTSGADSTPPTLDAEPTTEPAGSSPSTTGVMA